MNSIKIDINGHATNLIAHWQSNEVSTIPENRKWWEFWKIDTKRKKRLDVIFRFIIEAMDDLLNIVTNKTKEVIQYRIDIIDGISDIYDVVIADAELPWWTIPIRPTLKNIFVNILAPVLLDYMIRKL